MGRLFGTDGLRGTAGEFPLDMATTELLGRVLYFLLKERGAETRVIVGRDTRESGPALFHAFHRGFTQAGGHIDNAGVISTPAMAFLARNAGQCAVSITASHNPYHDNGIKIFGPDGLKLSEELELEIEPYLLGEKAFLRASDPFVAVNNGDLNEHCCRQYIAYLLGMFGDLDLRGTRIALDCANGALSFIAPSLLRQLGAEVVSMNVEPDGKNINQTCGSLYPEILFEHVKHGQYDCGFTFDGDGDRCLAVDAAGIYDGDYLMGTAACYLQMNGKLKKNAVVATHMSNLGLEVFLRRHGIELHRVPVGDKNVLEKLQREDLSLGGEQSGHIIFMNESFIGDGMLTALQMLRIYRSSRVPFSRLCDGFAKYPQILLNVAVKRKPELSTVDEIRDAMERIGQLLGDTGRIMVRYSGTEPLVRIMIEGPDRDVIAGMAADLGEIIRNKLN